MLTDGDIITLHDADQLPDHPDDSNTDAAAQRNDVESLQIDVKLDAIRARVKKIEEEADKLKRMHSAVNAPMTAAATPPDSLPIDLALDGKKEVDDRSVFVCNVDYHASVGELAQHFAGCGYINRVTILCNIDGRPKGFAYIEFGTKDAAGFAMALTGTLFRGRQINVRSKRTNQPRMSTTTIRIPRGFRGRNAGPGSRGGGGGGGGGGDDARNWYNQFHGSPGPSRGNRGRGNYYAPY